MDDGDDPFAAQIVPKCPISSSQEEVLRFSRFAGESESVPSQSTMDDSWLDEPATGILMASLPDSNNDLSTPHEDEDFKTPPEHSISQQISNDDQAPVALKTSGDRVNGCGSGGKAIEVDDLFADEQGVSLGENSDKLEFSKMKGNSEVDGVVGVSLVDCCSVDEIVEVVEVSDSGLRKIAGFEGEISVSRVCTEKLGTGTLTSNDGVVVEAEQTEMEKVGEGKLDLEFKEVCVGLVNRLVENTPNVSDKMPMKELEEAGYVGQSENVSVENSVRILEENGVKSKSHTTGENGQSGLACKSIEEIEKFKYVRTGGRRELPSSLREQGNNVEEVSRMAKPNLKDLSRMAKPNLKDLLDGLKLALVDVDDGAEKVDILETAKRRGLTFPRPRWWKPE